MSGDHNMNSFSDELEHQQAQEEAHYWFALSDVVSYIDTIGVEKVLIDLSMMLQERQNEDALPFTRLALDANFVPACIFMIGRWVQCHSQPQ